MSEQRHLDQDVAINAKVDGTPDREIRRHRIAELISLLVGLPRIGEHREGDAAIVDGRHHDLPEFRGRSVGERRRHRHHVHQTSLRRGEARVFAGEEEGDLRER